jgi:hypothetical protein
MIPSRVTVERLATDPHTSFTYATGQGLVKVFTPPIRRTRARWDHSRDDKHYETSQKYKDSETQRVLPSQAQDSKGADSREAEESRRLSAFGQYVDILDLRQTDDSFEMECHS